MFLRINWALLSQLTLLHYIFLNHKDTLKIPEEFHGGKQILQYPL